MEGNWYKAVKGNPISEHQRQRIVPFDRRITGVYIKNFPSIRLLSEANNCRGNIMAILKRLQTWVIKPFKRWDFIVCIITTLFYSRFQGIHKTEHISCHQWTRLQPHASAVKEGVSESVCKEKIYIQKLGSTSLILRWCRQVPSTFDYNHSASTWEPGAQFALFYLEASGKLLAEKRELNLDVCV